MKDFIKAISGRMKLPSIVFYLQILNLKNKISNAFKTSKKHTNTEFNHSKVVVLALFKKGFLREDVVNLISRLKKKGFYIIGVNTLKLYDSELHYFDKLIVRNNYGRDFGSYKKGFNEFYKLVGGESKSIEKLLMLNDSIFYSLDNEKLDKFIDD